MKLAARNAEVEAEMMNQLSKLTREMAEKDRIISNWENENKRIEKKFKELDQDNSHLKQLVGVKENQLNDLKSQMYEFQSNNMEGQEYEKQSMISALTERDKMSEIRIADLEHEKKAR